jgi:hypothetical protein
MAIEMRVNFGAKNTPVRPILPNWKIAAFNARAQTGAILLSIPGRTLSATRMRDLTAK